MVDIFLCGIASRAPAAAVGVADPPGRFPSRLHGDQGGDRRSPGFVSVRVGDADAIRLHQAGPPKGRSASACGNSSCARGAVRGPSTRQLGRAKASIRRSSISVDLYLIDDDKKVAQLFSDMANAKSITLSERATLDTRDPFNGAVSQITKGSRVPSSVKWLSPLIAPPMMDDGLPGPRSIRGNASYWMMPADLVAIMKWRLLGQQATKQRRE